MKRVGKILAIIFVAIIAIVLALVLNAVGWESYRVHSLRARARAIKVGDTKTEVERVMARPDSVFTANQSPALRFYHRYDTWSYRGFIWTGAEFSPRAPFVYLPHLINVLGTDSDDIVFEFDTSNRVVNITIPGVSE